MLYSSLKRQYYDEHDSVRILNVKQAAFYWGERGIKPISIYPSKNFKTGELCIVFIFSKSQTQEAYDLWCKNRPDELEIENWVNYGEK